MGSSLPQDLLPGARRLPTPSSGPCSGGITAPMTSGTRAGRPRCRGLGPEGGATEPRGHGSPRVTLRKKASAGADGSARLQPPALRRRPGTDLRLGSPSPETILSLRGGGRRGKEGEARPGGQGGRQAGRRAGEGGRKPSRANPARAAEQAQGLRSRDLPASSREMFGPEETKKEEGGASEWACPCVVSAVLPSGSGRRGRGRSLGS